MNLNQYKHLDKKKKLKIRMGRSHLKYVKG